MKSKVIFTLNAVIILLLVLFYPKYASAYCYESCDAKALGNQPSIYYCPSQSDPNVEDCSSSNRSNCYWSGWVWHTDVCWTPEVCTVNQQSCVPRIDTCKGQGCNINSGLPGFSPCVEETACAQAVCVPTGSGSGICVVSLISPTPTSIPTPAPPEPFLDLPWNYDCQQSNDQDLNKKCACQNITDPVEKAACEKDKKILSFDDAVFNINSWFDHTYPLQDNNDYIRDVLTFTGKRESYYTILN